MFKALTILTSLYSTSPRARALNITITQPNVPFAPDSLPPPGSSSHFEDIISQFVDLGRSTRWNLVEKVKFEGDTFEPEGLVRLGHDRYFVSAGEYTEPTVRYNDGVIINGTDRTAGAGFGHMIVFDGQGRRIVDATITEYHNGGLDYDGTYIWATLSQYRPNSTATLVRMRPDTLQPEPMLHMADHMGAVVHDLSKGDLVTLNWGSRNGSLWDSNEDDTRPVVSPAFITPRKVVKNPSQYTDYQDCKFLGHSRLYEHRPVMLCSGITTIYGTTIGGMALVDMGSMLPLYEIPLTMVSDLGTLVTNPMDVAVVDGKMRLYFLPDEMESTLYVYEAASA
ncbi:hypothetical protein B0H66DRAFT_486947 [Apodospora peruviana]|uniref:Uncharacterized protein n=1 Tax=Apodospora peruviana TaxID=516989 RepID=A0AAE0HRX4_9PEZI|nr:hypothetical protein B0H66DRAFT_486947 [Apodospora peruviana]